MGKGHQLFSDIGHSIYRFPTKQRPKREANLVLSSLDKYKAKAKCGNQFGVHCEHLNENKGMA
jgi:hypothetical protein